MEGRCRVDVGSMYVDVDRKICNKMRRRRETKENQKNEEGRGK